MLQVTGNRLVLLQYVLHTICVSSVTYLFPLWMGDMLGWEKDHAGKIAEDLIGQGLVEIKTLSGGIGITAQGVEIMQSSSGPASGDTPLSLGKGSVIESDGQTAVANILNEIKTKIAQSDLSYDPLEELVVDIKTIDVQMLSPRPKVAVVREVLRSLQQALSQAGLDDIAKKIGRMAEG